jgi:hypothetical protein
VDDAIDLGRVPFGAPHSSGINEYGEFTADQTAQVGARHRSLTEHQTAKARAPGCGRDLSRKASGSGPVLGRVGVGGEAVDAGGADEVEQLGELMLSFAGEADNECRADVEVWDCTER